MRMVNYRPQTNLNKTGATSSFGLKNLSLSMTKWKTVWSGGIFTTGGHRTTTRQVFSRVCQIIEDCPFALCTIRQQLVGVQPK